MKQLYLCLTFLTGLFFVSHAQNVGIGTVTPSTRLHVVSTQQNAATFSGASSMWLTLAENNIERGYIGSFSGNAEDVDFGTYSTNTTGKIHLTTGNIPRLTVTPAGNIGIAQQNPLVPLQFANTGGNKIAFFQSGSNYYGIGTQASLLQFYTPASGDDIAFGFGNSSVFTENMRIKGNGAVGIGTTNPNSTALLEMNSTNKGLLIPRMNSVQREAIANPATGLMVFDLQYKRIFMFDGTEWLPLITGTKESLSGGPQVPADNTASSQFGYSTGIDSLWAIAGAPYQNNQVGAAYIYQRQNGEWTEAAKLIPDDGTQQYFGGSVSIDYPYAVVGAPGHNFFAGCAYVFFHNGTSWVQVNKFFKPINNIPFNYFGYSVDIDGNNIVTGCPGADDVIYNGGAIYTYKLNAGSWSYNNAPSVALDSNSFLGYAVAIAYEKIAAGVPGDALISGRTTTARTNGLILPPPGAGAINMYNFNGGNWAFSSKLTVTNSPSWRNNGLGSSVDLHYSPGLFANYVLASGAPASYDPNAPSGYRDIGSIYLFCTSGLNPNTFTPIANVFNKPEQNSTQFPAAGYKYGQSVSVWHKAATASSYPGTEIVLYVGVPGMNNGQGAIAEIYFCNTAAPSFSSTSFAEKLVRYVSGTYTNGLLGQSVSVFDRQTTIAGIPGAAGNKGSVLLGF